MMRVDDFPTFRTRQVRLTLAGKAAIAFRLIPAACGRLLQRRRPVYFRRTLT